MKADIVVYDRNKQIALIAEVKKKPGVTSEWAVKWRRNILAHGELPDVTFFMVALPDRFYLWKNAGNQPELVEPSFEIDAEPILRPYLERNHVSVEEIDPQSFEFVISGWLNSLVLQNKETDIQNQVIQSGLFNAIRGGHLEHEVALL